MCLAPWLPSEAPINRAWCQDAQVPVLSLQLTSCATLSELLTPPRLGFPICEVGRKTVHTS